MILWWRSPFVQQFSHTHDYLPPSPRRPLSAAESSENRNALKVDSYATRLKRYRDRRNKEILFFSSLESRKDPFCTIYASAFSRTLLANVFSNLLTGLLCADANAGKSSSDTVQIVPSNSMVQYFSKGCIAIAKAIMVFLAYSMQAILPGFRR